MPVSLAALFAAAIHQLRAPLIDAESMGRTVSLLARAAGGNATTLELRDDTLMVNGTPLAPDAPGVAAIRQSLLDHHTMRLALPQGLTAQQWHEVVELYASTPGLYNSVDDVRDTLRFTLPNAVVSGATGAAAEGDLREALFELPGLRVSGATFDPTPRIDPHNAELADLSVRLDPLLRAAERARDSQNYEQLAHTLLAINALEERNNDDRRAIVARERRRVVSSDVLEVMARTIPRPRSPAVIGRVLGLLGHDGAEALIGALNGAHGVQERRAYIDVLVACRDCDDAILEALTNERPELVRDAAEVAGRKGIERAVPRLTQLLKHAQVDMRTTAWHALELIGTRDAMKALRT